MRSFSSFHKYRKWEKVTEPLARYTRGSSSLGYPLDFFYQLEQKISAGHHLQLNIATTLTGSKDNCLKTVFEADQQVGRVIYTPSILKSTFDGQLQKENQERLSKFSERDSQFDQFYTNLKETSTSQQFFPLAVLKQKEQNGDCKVRTLSQEQFKKIVNIESHQIAQGFILGNGKQTSIIRFVYFPSKQNSEAFKVDNLEGFMRRRFSKGQFKVQEQTQNSLTFVKIMYTNKSFYRQCNQLVQFLEKYAKIKIDKIVTDWVLDPNNRYYLIDVKEISYTAKVEVSRPLRVMTDSALVTCEVCQTKLKRQQLSKVITDKLIRQFVDHLKKRQVDLSFDIAVKPCNDTSKVCDLCYNLIVSEAELIELQKKIAMVTHNKIPQKRQLQSNLLSFSKGKMFEWRLFLYLEDIRDLQIDNIDPKASYYVMMKIHNSVTSFKIKSPNQRYNLIKGIKMHYLFSEKKQIDQFLANSEIIIRITKGNNWNNVIGEGNTSGLYEENQKQTMRKFKQILVFNQKSEFSVVGIHIGVKRQGMFDPSQLVLHNAFNVYMVENGYSNCYALPAEWMETIDPSYCIEKSDSGRIRAPVRERKGVLPSLVPQGKKKLVLS